MSADEKTSPKRSLRPLWFVVLLILIAVIFVAGYLPRRRQQKEVEGETRAHAESLPRVNVERVERAKAASSLSIPGTTLPFTEANIYARASGYVSKRLADIGDRVHEGQLLATIDAPDLDRQVAQARSNLEQSQATLVQMQAQLHLASLNWDRYKVLVAKGVFSRQEGDQQEANYRVAEANVNAAEKMIAGNRENLKRLEVLQQYERVQAPFTGIVTARNIDVGTLITASGSGVGSSGGGSSGLSSMALQGNNQGVSGNVTSSVEPSTGSVSGGQMFAIAAVSRLRVLASVPESYTESIQVGQRAALVFPGQDRQPIQAQVTRTSASIDQNTRTLLVEIVVNNRYGLVPGMYVMVNFVDAKRVPPITIPGSAIVVRNARQTVAVVDGQVVHYQTVTLGRDYGDRTEITGGLKPGDVIALDVTDEIEDGSHVIPQFPKPKKENNQKS